MTFWECAELGFMLTVGICIRLLVFVLFPLVILGWLINKFWVKNEFDDMFDYLELGFMSTLGLPFFAVVFILSVPFAALGKIIAYLDSKRT